MKISKKVIACVIILGVIISSSIYFYKTNQSKYSDITYKKFLSEIKKENVEEVSLSEGSKVKGKLKDGKYFKTDNPRTEGFKEKLLMSNVKVIEPNDNSILNNTVILIVTLAGISGILYATRKNTSKQAEKEMSQMSDIESSEGTTGKLKFDDIAGNEEAKDSVKELVDFIKNPDKYERYGARMPRGVLLYGPPGTGKTLLAKALAGEAEVPFFAVTGSDFVEVYTGLGASRIRNLFKKARQKGKCVIFIDEIDALGKKRKDGPSGGSDEGDRTLNALLTEMSGFKGNEGIIVMAATNRIDTLDEALLRPGRFDRQIEIGLPDINARHKILELHSKDKPVSENVDFRQIAYQTVYFSGAKLESLMNESAMLAAKHNDTEINMNHIDRAFYTVIAGEEKKDRSSISLEEKKITAYHEVGHALMTKLTSPKNRVTKISIIPSTKGIGGFSMNIPQDKMYHTKKDIENNIMVALGGRAAEEIKFGKDDITTGALNDLQKTTDMAMSMVGKFGMDEEIGLLNYEVVLGSNLGSNSYIIERTKVIIKELYDRTLKTLKENEILLENVTSKLLEKETLNEDELNEMFENACQGVKI
ncbi:cell division protease-like protein [Gottschalkia acidurici 9a]|uniref:ATP-dependent zinc metalloprotease FtsH n=1 Tax=Gottschalkia acidurici (strain ATCC 7906 / DSM 604 / BCRC 14475 / CIP 104303 / KCTC 5404 / NCIMB 10678 / 9a) TaxID=1128398 RepID=K0AVU7_GOTA9|nr:ATP-dependent zinc metalloprotease FtsH [Gottschalkia acidurici]AFS77988.1 cell division protease-like protein [Gottschalkia acidurici 9a]